MTRSLNELINFSIFKNCPHDLTNNDEFPLSNLDENYFYLTDGEIKDFCVSISHCDYLIDTVSKNLSEKKLYIKLKDRYIAKHCDINNIDTSIYYKIDDKFYLFMFKIFYTKTMSVEMIGLIDKQTSQYLFIGSHDERLFVRCNRFSWADNYDLGPLMTLSGIINPNKLLRILSTNWQLISEYKY